MKATGKDWSYRIKIINKIFIYVYSLRNLYLHQYFRFYKESYFQYREKVNTVQTKHLHAGLYQRRFVWYFLG